MRHIVISIIIPLVVIALIVLIVAGIRVEAKEGGDDLIRNVYVYLVLFATLMMTIGGSVGIFMAAADIIAPAPHYQTFEDFKNMGIKTDYPDKDVTKDTKLSEQELRKKYDAMIAEQRVNQIERAKNSLIKSCGWIIIPLPVFIFFQRRLLYKND